MTLSDTPQDQLRAATERAEKAEAALAVMVRLAAGVGYDETDNEVFDRLLGAVLMAVDGESRGTARLGSATGAMKALRAAFLRGRSP